MKGIWSESTWPTARSSPRKPNFSRSSRAVEKARPSENFGKLRAITAKRGRSAARSSWLSPASRKRPIGAVGTGSSSRSLSQRALPTITGRAPSWPPSGAGRKGSSRKAPAFQIGPSGSSAPVRACQPTAIEPVAAGSGGAIGRPERWGSASRAGIEGLLEGLGPQAAIGGEKGLLRPGAQFQVGVDHRLDRIDDAIGAKARTGDAGQGRILRARASEQQLVVFLAPLLDAQNADRPDVMVSAGVEAARNLDLELTHLVLARRQPRRDALGNGNGARIGEPTVVEAGAGDDVGREPGIGFGETDRLQRLIDRPEVAHPHVRQYQVLLVADAHLIEGEALRQLGDRLHLGGRGIAGNAADRFQRDGDNGETRLLVGVGVARHPAIEATIRRAQARRRRFPLKRGRLKIVPNARNLRRGQLEHTVFDATPFRLDLGGKGVRAEAVDEDLDAGLVDVVAPAVQVVDAQDGLDVAEEVRFGQPIADFLGEVGRAPLAAPDPHGKTQATVIEAFQLEANVVGLDRAAVMLAGRD